MAEPDVSLPSVNFPPPPEEASQEMKDYLLELERVLGDALRGSIFINKTLEDGILGN